MNRRSFLKHAATGAALAAPALHLNSQTTDKPNILFIMADQFRSHQWFPDQATMDLYLPNLARIRNGAVSFGRHYTAATMCTPSRACLLTGLYPYQNGVFLTGIGATEPYLQTAFPTWGKGLRANGYKTFWYGKWHVADTNPEPCNMEQYGFSGGTCPSPNGVAGGGTTRDPAIVDQFISWMQVNGSTGPWCTTVSLINPHDIQWYPRWTNQIPSEANPPSVFKSLPANFETDTALAANKPRLQTFFQDGMDQHSGTMRYSGVNWQKSWLKMLDLYLLLEQYVDTQIGRVLDALAANPTAAAKTIIMFTSDHGDYCGSHGLRGKGGGAYEEAIRIPFYVKDPTGKYSVSPSTVRTQMTSSVDVMGLMLTIGSGGNTWRSLPEYAHIANRLDMAAILKSSTAPGRPYIVHESDEQSVEDDDASLVGGLPHHIAAIFNPTGKLALYNYWDQQTLAILPDGQEAECYDYATDGGRKEVQNLASSKPPLYNTLYNTLMSQGIPQELRKPLPSSLQAAQQAAFTAYRNFNGVS